MIPINKMKMTTMSSDAHDGASAKRHETAADVRGWRFSCCSAPAMSSAERDALTHALRLRPPMESLPEMLFADNQLTLNHARSRLSLRFDALAALRMWSQTRGECVRCLTPCGSFPVERERERWRNSCVCPRSLDHDAVLDYTFGSSYCGSVAVETEGLHNGERRYVRAEIRKCAAGRF